MIIQQSFKTWIHHKTVYKENKSTATYDIICKLLDMKIKYNKKKNKNTSNEFCFSYFMEIFTYLCILCGKLQLQISWKRV